MNLSADTCVSLFASEVVCVDCVRVLFLLSHLVLRLQCLFQLRNQARCVGLVPSWLLPQNKTACPSPVTMRTDSGNTKHSHTVIPIFFCNSSGISAPGNHKLYAPSTPPPQLANLLSTSISQRSGLCSFSKISYKTPHCHPQLWLSPCLFWTTHSWCSSAGSDPCSASEVILRDICIQQSLSL